MTPRRPSRWAACAALVVALAAHAGPRVHGGDAHLQYTGRVDLTQAQAPVLSWPASSVAGNFTGSRLAVSLNDQSGGNYFNAVLDGDLDHPRVVKAEPGEHTYVLAERLSPGRHQFVLSKRTEGEDGATAVTGFELADDGEWLPPPARAQRRIEFFGDSITSGMGNEAPDGQPDNLAAQKNSALSYAAITARNLGAEAHLTSHSGIGIMVSWFPFTMPQYHAQLNAVGLNASRWDFSRWTPDVVVINLLQNDRWLIDREHRLVPDPTEAQRIDAYADFVSTVRGHYPRAYIVCALGSMDAVRPGSPWPGYITAAVERLRRDKGDDRIAPFFFEFTGYEAHPRVPQHQANAARLTAFIQQKMGW